jgi:hypothetical protein
MKNGCFWKKSQKYPTFLGFVKYDKIISFAQEIKIYHGLKLHKDQFVKKKGRKRPILQ